MNIRFFIIFANAIRLYKSDFAQMSETLEKLWNGTEGQHRGLVDMMGPTMDVINGYGCWCYFNDDHGKGKSKPVNEIDAYCKTLHEGYECAILDGIEEGSTCEPWNSAYRAVFISFLEQI